MNDLYAEWVRQWMGAEVSGIFGSKTRTAIGGPLLTQNVLRLEGSFLDVCSLRESYIDDDSFEFGRVAE